MLIFDLIIASLLDTYEEGTNLDRVHTELTHLNEDLSTLFL